MKFRVLFFVLIFGIISPSFLLGQNCTWDGSTSTDWHDASNWTTSNLGVVITNRIPLATDTVIIVTQANEPNIGASAVAKDLIITSGTLTIASDNDLEIEGNFTMNGGVLAMQADAQFLVAGNWNDNSGTFNPAGGIVILNSGTSSTITTNASNFFMEFAIRGTNSDYTAQSNLDINDNLEITSSNILTMNGNSADIATYTRVRSGGRLNLTSGNFVVGGAFRAEGDVVFSGTDAGTLKIANSGTNNQLDNFICGTNSTVHFNGATRSNYSFCNL